VLGVFEQILEKDFANAMLYSRLPRIAFKFIRFKAQRAHPLTLALAVAGLAAITVLVTIQFVRAAEKSSTSINSVRSSNIRYDYKSLYHYR
jgi:hypothetical protein